MAEPDPPDAREAGPPAILPATQELIARIGWYIRLRWVAVGAIVVFVETIRRVLPLQLHLQLLYGVVGVLAAYNLVMAIAFHRMRVRDRREDRAAATGAVRIGPVARLLLPPLPAGLAYGRTAGAAAVFANLQILVDLLLLALLLHAAGGIENPARVFFLFHVIIASILLSRRATYAHATIGLVLITAVALLELRGMLPHYALNGPWRPDAFQDPRLVGAQLLVLAITLYATAYAGTTIAARLRRREVDALVLSRQLADKADHLEAAYREVRGAEKVKSQYMRKVAHELRGPLGMIRTALSVVLESPHGGMAASERELVEMAHARAGELAAATQELLALARARGARTAVEPVPVDLGALATGVVEKLRLRAEERRVSVQTDVSADLGTLRGDPEGLGDLMGNLLENAIRYNPDGGTVWFRVSGTPDEVVIDVRDTGIGIPEEDLPRIFDEFYRSKTARAFTPQGSGLGLAIVQAVVEQHGGAIAVDSTPGRGTHVRVRLPR
jgi:signal transduction histidine kinase